MHEPLGADEGLAGPPGLVAPFEPIHGYRAHREMREPVDPDAVGKGRLKEEDRRHRRRYHEPREQEHITGGEGEPAHGRGAGGCGDARSIACERREATRVGLSRVEGWQGVG
jgi:hypothetical protein